MIDRLRRLREAAAAIGADGAIVTHPANRHYFSGFPAERPRAGRVVGGTRRVEGVGDPLYRPDEPAVGRECGPATGDSTALEQTVAGVPRPGAAVARDPVRGVRRPSALRRGSRGIVGAAGETRLVPVGNAFHALRAVKSEQELATIAEAARITDAAFVAATSAAEPGVYRDSAGVADRVRDARSRRGRPRFPGHRRRRTARRAPTSRPERSPDSGKGSQW